MYKVCGTHSTLPFPFFYVCFKHSICCHIKIKINKNKNSVYLLVCVWYFLLSWTSSIYNCPPNSSARNSPAALFELFKLSSEWLNCKAFTLNGPNSQVYKLVLFAAIFCFTNYILWLCLEKNLISLELMRLLVIIRFYFLLLFLSFRYNYTARYTYELELLLIKPRRFWSPIINPSTIDRGIHYAWVATVALVDPLDVAASIGSHHT